VTIQQIHLFCVLILYILLNPFMEFNVNIHLMFIIIMSVSAIKKPPLVDNSLLLKLSHVFQILMLVHKLPFISEIEEQILLLLF